MDEDGEKATGASQGSEETRTQAAADSVSKELESHTSKAPLDVIAEDLELIGYDEDEEEDEADESPDGASSEQAEMPGDPSTDNQVLPLSAHLVAAQSSATTNNTTGLSAPQLAVPPTSRHSSARHQNGGSRSSAAVPCDMHEVSERLHGLLAGNQSAPFTMYTPTDDTRADCEEVVIVVSEPEEESESADEVGSATDLTILKLMRQEGSITPDGFKTLKRSMVLNNTDLPMVLQYKKESDQVSNTYKILTHAYERIP